MDRVLSGTLLGDADRLLIVDAIELNHSSAMGLIGDADRLLGDADCFLMVVAMELNHSSAMGLVGDADRGSSCLLGDADRSFMVVAIDENQASAMGLLEFESSVSNHLSASHSALRVLTA
jgi:hypothetical protein